MVREPRNTQESNETFQCNCYCYPDFSIYIYAPITYAAAVNVASHGPYSYEDSSIRQLKIRGKCGRWIAFIGRSTNSWYGPALSCNPGSQVYVSCKSYGYSITCDRIWYIAPSCAPGRSGGPLNRHHDYVLDCKDCTFDRKVGRARAICKEGWMSGGGSLSLGGCTKVLLSDLIATKTNLS